MRHAVIQRNAALLEAGEDAVNHIMPEFASSARPVRHRGSFWRGPQRGAAVANQLFNRLALFMEIVIAVTDQQKLPVL